MKNLFIVLLTIAFSFVNVNAQNAEKDFKKAEKTISKLSSEPSENAAELKSAIADMHASLLDNTVASNMKNWISAGEALNKVASQEFKMKTINAAYKIVAPKAATEAYNAFVKASKLDNDKRSKDVVYGLQESENHLNNFAIFAYQNKDYARAFDNFAASVSAHDLLNSLGKDSRLDDPATLNDQVFLAAVSAYYSDQLEEAKPYLQKLHDGGSTEPFVYEALYNATVESDKTKALAYLSKGREISPDDTGLLFAEINHYLKAGELDLLIGKLKSAIEKEPDNISIYTTLGSVYDQLHQKENAEGSTEKAKEYFDKALDYYNQVIAKDSSNFDATYSIGALYYNKAASYVETLNSYASDLSPKGMKAYDETKAEMDGVFKQALPLFERAEALNGNDRNTLIALKEIHARLNNLELSNKYKGLLEDIGIENK